MNPREFFINPADYGLPTQEELVAYRIGAKSFGGRKCFHFTGTATIMSAANPASISTMEK